MVFSHLSSACKKSFLLQLARSNHEQLHWTVEENASSYKRVVKRSVRTQPYRSWSVFAQSFFKRSTVEPPLYGNGTGTFFLTCTVGTCTCTLYNQQQKFVLYCILHVHNTTLQHSTVRTCMYRVMIRSIENCVQYIGCTTVQIPVHSLYLNFFFLHACNCTYSGVLDPAFASLGNINGKGTSCTACPQYTYI